MNYLQVTINTIDIKKILKYYVLICKSLTGNDG